MKHRARLVERRRVASHPVRVRGLKLEFEVNHGVVKTSHPVRVRGLKLGGDG